MASDPRSFHLPDLPTAGYSTGREKELTDQVMLFMREIDRNRLRLLCIVLEGMTKWRTVAGTIWRGMRIAEEHSLLDDIFRYFEVQAAGSAPAVQAEMLRNAQNPLKWREAVTSLTPHWEYERDALMVMQGMMQWVPTEAELAVLKKTRDTSPSEWIN